MGITQSDQKISCAICGPAPYTVKYRKKQISGKLDFSARRIDNNTHLRIVVCDQCSLVYSNPIPPSKEIIETYAKAEFHDDFQIIRCLRKRILSLISHASVDFQLRR